LNSLSSLKQLHQRQVFYIGLLNWIGPLVHTYQQTIVPNEQPKSCNRNSKHKIVQGQRYERSKKESKPSNRERDFPARMMTRKMPELKIRTL
jgi:hypothetical protein